jgi:Transposase, Mutator family
VTECIKHLKERGLKGVRLIISDACMGLSESAAEFFPEAAWQRCIVHWYRNILSHVPSTKVREIAAMLKAIHAGEDIVAARQKAGADAQPLLLGDLIGVVGHEPEHALGAGVAARHRRSILGRESRRLLLRFRLGAGA